MSLYVNKSLTKKYQCKPDMSDGDQVFTFYKQFGWSGTRKSLITPFQKMKISKPGVIEAKGSLDIKQGELIYCVCYKPEIYGGAIHAYIKREPYRIIGVLVNKIIIPIEVKKKHIIAAGDDNDICFFKCTITENVWKNAWNKILWFKEKGI